MDSQLTSIGGLVNSDSDGPLDSRRAGAGIGPTWQIKTGATFHAPGGFDVSANLVARHGSNAPLFMTEPLGTDASIRVGDDLRAGTLWDTRNIHEPHVTYLPHRFRTGLQVGSCRATLGVSDQARDDAVPNSHAHGTDGERRGETVQSHIPPSVACCSAGQAEVSSSYFSYIYPFCRHNYATLLPS